VQKWCLELNNHSPYDIFLPVGAVICQIVFHEVTPPLSMYGDIGSYSAEGEWRPEMMLPRRMKVRSGV
jgi:deoxycytidine triphosphate deaminase